jgi:hypothetical protein
MTLDRTMTRRAELRAVVEYLVVVTVVFLAFYVAVGVREMGLNVVQMLANLPASVVVVPYMESFAQSRGWELGRPLHVWTTQVTCMVVNAILVGALALLAVKLWRFVRGYRSAV